MAAKRCFDLLVLILLAPFWLPVLGVVGLFVRWDLGSPVFFRQERTGRGEKPFVIVKFRTMRDARDASGRLLSDAERLTSFGKWLRSSSLDELPELFNVLRGEMSLVGPRPLFAHYLTRYSVEQRRRHEVPPGLTGLAQVNGRNALSWEDKFAWDVRYVDERSFWLDLQILGRTAIQVLLRRGISAPGEATMPEFLGNESERK
ncbi:MAG: sugar transferase [Opitutae bacterium]|nr:sugar transferase [Opitutae bacterium]